MSHADAHGRNCEKPGGDVQHAVQKFQQEGKRSRIRIYGGVVCWSAAMILLIIAIRIAPTHILPCLAVLLVALFFILAGTLVALPRAGNDTRATALTLLAERPDREILTAIGPLIDALDLALGAQPSDIRALLTTLLPRLTPADASVLTRRQRNRLGDILLLGDATGEAKYLGAILKGLEQVGDEETLYTIRQLVQRGAVTVAQRRVLVAATVCLQSLESRLQQDRNRDDLLRGAAPTATSTELLRPTNSQPDPHPETLLRLPNNDPLAERLGSVGEPIMAATDSVDL